LPHLFVEPFYDGLFSSKQFLQDRVVDVTATSANVCPEDSSQTGSH
jgi:hypothetical protein